MLKISFWALKKTIDLEFVVNKLEGNYIKLTTEIAQKSRDSMLLIGARVRVRHDDEKNAAW